MTKWLLSLTTAAMLALYTFHPRVQIKEIQVPVQVQTKGATEIIYKTVYVKSHRRATLEDVRKDWGIDGPLYCQVGPYQTKGPAK